MPPVTEAPSPAPPPSRIDPSTIVTYYINANTGDNNNDGLSESTPFKTIQKATQGIQSGTEVLVADGTYRNYNYNTNKLDNSAVAAIRNVNDIIIRALPGHSPKIEVRVCKERSDELRRYIFLTS